MSVGDATDGERGFTLVEVMVAIAIIGLGMFAVTGLQMQGMQGSRDAAARARSTTLANAMADHIRANPEAHGGPDAYDQVHKDVESVANAPDCHANECTAEELAQYEFARWDNRLRERLTSGEAVICRDGADGASDDGSSAASPSCEGSSDDPYAIKIWWTDSDAQSASDLNRYVLTFRP